VRTSEPHPCARKSSTSQNINLVRPQDTADFNITVNGQTREHNSQHRSLEIANFPAFPRGRDKEPVSILSLAAENTSTVLHC
jgi:LPS sulfotransferase NodH